MQLTQGMEPSLDTEDQNTLERTVEVLWDSRAPDLPDEDIEELVCARALFI